MAHTDIEESAESGQDEAALYLSRRTGQVQGYDNKELRPFDGRPGAMDAYKLPSRVLDQLIYPRERK